VNQQAWMAVWASTVTRLDPSPNYYHWDELFPEHFMPVFSSVSGLKDWDYEVFLRKNAELEAAFRRRAVENIRARPGIYLHNIARSGYSFAVDINSVLVKVFQYIQQPGREIDKRWFLAGNSQDFYPERWSAAFSGFIRCLSFLGGAGVLLAVRRRDRFVLVPASIFSFLWLTQSLVYMDLMYYYQKLPFLFVFAFYFIDQITDGPLALRYPMQLLARLLVGLLLITGLGLSAVLL